MNNIKYFAIVEDNESDLNIMLECLSNFSKANNYRFEIDNFANGAEFLKCDSCKYDIVFMDIELPDGNGLSFVETLRKTNKTIMVIFVTNMKQYALKGYSVRAFDFIVKPVVYYDFSLKLSSALETLDQYHEHEIWIENKDGKIRIKSSEIKYVEVVKHYVTYHTIKGNYTILDSLSNVTNKLKEAPFSLCNRCYLVNLKYVTKVNKISVFIGDEELQISRQKYALFVKDLNNYLAGGR